jgi:hypothetical protein
MLPASKFRDKSDYGIHCSKVQCHKIIFTPFFFITYILPVLLEVLHEDQATFGESGLHSVAYAGESGFSSVSYPSKSGVPGESRSPVRLTEGSP